MFVCFIIIAIITTNDELREKEYVKRKTLISFVKICTLVRKTDYFLITNKNHNVSIYDAILLIINIYIYASYIYLIIGACHKECNYMQPSDAWRTIILNIYIAKNIIIRNKSIQIID